MALLLAILALVALTSPVECLINGVTRATFNGTALQRPVQFLVREPTEDLLYGLSTGGVVYRIDAFSMVVNALKLTATSDNPDEPLGLHIDDAVNRLYAIFYSTSQSSSIVYIINTTSFASIASNSYDFPTKSGYKGASYYISLTFSKILGIFMFLPNNLNTYYWNEYNVTNNIPSSRFRAFVDGEGLSALSGIAYDQANDKLIAWGNYDTGDTVFTDRIWVFDDYKLIADGTDVGSAKFFGNSAFTASIGAGNLKFVGGPQFSTNTSYFVPYRSTLSLNPQGSSIVQFLRPTNVVSISYTPRAFILFPDENNFQSLSVDQVGSVMFIGNSLGEIKKYRVSDPGGNGQSFSIGQAL